MNEVLFAVLTAIGGIATTLFKTIKFVQEGELGIRLRFGRAVRDKGGRHVIIPPGFVLMIPWVDTLKRHHVRQQTLRMDNQRVLIHRGLVFNVSAIVIFKVIDIYKAMFEIHDLETSVDDISMGILRDVLSHKEYDELGDTEEISDALLHRLQEKANEWGVQFIQFKLTNCNPTPETASIINAKASVQIKMEALEVAAQRIGCNVAQISPTLAAAIIGVPVVTTIAPPVVRVHSNNTGDQNHFSLFGGTSSKDESGE